MKSNAFFKGLSWLIALNLLVKPVWIFFIDRQVQNTVGHEAYGKYFALLNLSFVLLFLADAGLGTLLNQRMAYQEKLNTRQLIRIKGILLLLYFISGCFIGWLTHITQWNLLIYIFLIQLLNSLFVFLRNIITARQYFTADAWFSILDKFLMILICGSLLYTTFFGTINLVIFLQVQLACTSIATILLLWFIMQKKLLVVTGDADAENIIRAVIPFALVILLMGIHYRLDGFLLERLHPNGAYEAGVYASAYRLLDAGNMVGYLAASFLLSFISRHQHQSSIMEGALLPTRHGLLLLSAGLVSFTLVFAPWIQQVLYHSSGPYHSNVLALCLSALPAYYLVHIYGSALTATYRLNSFIAILVISVVLNLILNLLLLPVYGALGCCMAALASQYFCGIACWMVASKSLGISRGLNSMLLYLLAGGFMFLVFYLGKMAISNVWVILATAVCLTIFLLAAQPGVLKKYLSLIR